MYQLTDEEAKIFLDHINYDMLNSRIENTEKEAIFYYYRRSTEELLFKYIAGGATVEIYMEPVGEELTDPTPYVKVHLTDVKQIQQIFDIQKEGARNESV